MARRKKEEVSESQEPQMDEEECFESEEVSDQKPDTYSELVAVLKGRTKVNVPTLVSYTPKGSSTVKYVIVDMDNDGINLAWSRYKMLEPYGNSEDFLVKLYNITRQDIPRMYRNVALAHLE